MATNKCVCVPTRSTWVGSSSANTVLARAWISRRASTPARHATARACRPLSSKLAPSSNTSAPCKCDSVAGFFSLTVFDSHVWLVVHLAAVAKLVRGEGRWRIASALCVIATATATRARSSQWQSRKACATATELWVITSNLGPCIRICKTDSRRFVLLCTH